jgi:hypothetical protein
MTYMKKQVCLTLIFALTGCSHTWVGKPGYMFESEKAQCSYIARHGGSGFYAQGSQSFVAGAQLGHTLGEIARQIDDFDDCMKAKGWRVADDSTSSSSYQQPTQYYSSTPSKSSRYDNTSSVSTPVKTTLEPLPNESTKSKFEKGDIRLTCGLDCSKAWADEKSTWKSFDENKFWEKLVNSVIKVNFISNQSYYFLGRASEGLGHFETARIYYNLSLTSERNFECASTSTGCNNVIFPDIIRKAIENLSHQTSDSKNTSTDKLIIDNLDEVENKCKELGFKPKSPKFGKCVLGLSK